MALRGCEVCGKGYEAVRASSRFCGDTCKKRAQRAARPAKDVPLTCPVKAKGVTPTENAKRGTDIKCFADLPPDVQETIMRVSVGSATKTREQEIAQRTKAAIKYQHVCPDRYDPRGQVRFSPAFTQLLMDHLPGDPDYVGAG
jgi:hypothetical protein